MTKKELELSYEIEKLKAKLNLASDITKKIDRKIFDMLFKCSPNDIKEIVEQAKEIRNELRDFSDFLKERKGGI